VQLGSLHPGAFVIAVDACLGRASNVEKIIMMEKPLKPGTGVNKELPEVGDVTIQGIVNIGGFMPHLVIQNTRMNTIYNMSRVIAGTLAQTIIAHRNFTPIYQLKQA
jgi:putative sporulation protein YyaC